MNSVLLVHLDQNLSEELFAGERTGVIFANVITPEEALFEVKRNRLLSTVVLGSGIREPIQTIQKLHSLSADLSIILLCEAGRIPALKRAIQFAPFVGRNVRCVEDRADTVQLAISQELERVRQRKGYVALVNEVNKGLAVRKAPLRNPEDRWKHTFLDQLLESVPIGIASVDEHGCLLSLNRAGAEIIEQNEAQLIGQALGSLFPDFEARRSLTIQIKRAAEERTFRSAPTVFGRSKLNGSSQYLEVVVASLTGKEEASGAIVLLQDVSERVEAHGALLDRQRELTEAVQTRDEFLSIASHELRTPLTPLKMQLQLLDRILRRSAEGKVSAEQVLKINSVAVQQIDRLNRLVNNLLDVARINSGKIELSREVIHLRALCHELAATYGPQGALIGCPIEVDAPEEISGSWDRLRLEQVVVNLLTNALKYCEGSPVKLKLRARAEGAEISVVDKGPGISAVDQERIFERFERVGSTSNIGGLGLGLFISQQIARAHGGLITVKSALGEGAEFTLLLPREQAPS